VINTIRKDFVGWYLWKKFG